MGSAFVLEGHVNGLGLARALGENGIEVYLLDKNKYNLARYSKHCKRFLKIPDEIKHPEDYIYYLESLKKKNNLNEPVIFPTHDDQVYILSKYKRRLEENFKVSVPEWSVTKKCYNKVYTYKIADELGIPIPRSYFGKDGIDLEEINELMEYPFIIKPAIMHKFYERTGKKAFKVNDFEDLKEKYKKYSSVVKPDDLIFQEIIPGGPENLYSYGCFFKNGEELRSMIKISRRQVPMDFGTSTYVEKTKSREVREMSKKILKEIGYNGLCEVEFKKDPRDGKFKFFEINPRPWKWHSLFLANGINLPYLLYQDLKGEEIEKNFENAIVDIKWIDFYPDLFISSKEILSRRLRIKDYIKSMRGKKTFAVFQKDDLMPFIFESLLLPYLYKQRT